VKRAWNEYVRDGPPRRADRGPNRGTVLPIVFKALTLHEEKYLNPFIVPEDKVDWPPTGHYAKFMISVMATNRLADGIWSTTTDCDTEKIALVSLQVLVC
jgi:hypothetical protein